MREYEMIIEKKKMERERERERERDNTCYSWVTKEIKIAATAKLKIA